MTGMGGMGGGGDCSVRSTGHGSYQPHDLPLSPKWLQSPEVWYAPHIGVGYGVAAVASRARGGEGVSNAAHGAKGPACSTCRTCVPVVQAAPRAAALALRVRLTTHTAAARAAGRVGHLAADEVAVAPRVASFEGARERTSAPASALQNPAASVPLRTPCIER